MKIINKVILIASIFLFFETKACECSTITGFISSYNYIKNDSLSFFVKGVVIKKQQHGIVFKLLQKTAQISKDTIIIWGDNGALCRIGYLSDYQLNDTLLATIKLTDFAGNGINDTIEKSGDYMFMSCRISTVKLKNGYITGKVYNYGQDTTVSLNELYNPTVTETLEINENNKVHIYPNPVINFAKLTLPISFGKINRHQIISSSGYIIKSIQDPKDEVDLSFLPIGFYFIEISNNQGQIIRSKIIKE